jgi:hypothetical protein
MAAMTVPSFENKVTSALSPEARRRKASRCSAGEDSAGGSALHNPSQREADLLHRLTGEMPEQRGCQKKNADAGQQRQIEAQIKTQHQSCALAKT